MWVRTSERTLYITRQYKDTLRRRLIILRHFVTHLSGYTCTNNYSNRERLDKVIAKIKWCSFCLTEYKSISINCARNTYPRGNKNRFQCQIASLKFHQKIILLSFTRTSAGTLHTFCHRLKTHLF